MTSKTARHLDNSSSPSARQTDIGTDQEEKERRAKGEGALRQRPDGIWEATLDMGFVNGRRRRTAYRGRTRSEALAKRRHAAEGLGKGRRVLNSRVTVGELCDEWLGTKIEAKVALSEIKEQTAQNYRDVYSAYVKPIVGDVLVRSLRTADVDAMSTRMRNAELSQNTVRLARTVLRMALGYAISEELISVNVVNESVRPNVATSAEDHTTLTVKQAKRLLTKAPNDVFGLLLRVALWTGMREGELVGLLWEDVDMKGRRLMVCGTLGRVKGKGLVRSTPKTQASKAPVPLPMPVMQILRRQLRQQTAQRKEAEDLWQNTGLVFTSDFGGAIDGRRVLREWRKIQDNLSLPDMTVHDLRHTTATLLLNAGVPLEVVSSILRHASIRVTRDIYAKVEEPLARAGMQKYASALGKTDAG